MGDHEPSRALRDELLSRWNEPHRRYHGASHLADVLATIDELGAVEPDADRVRTELAAWFHDAIYDPRRADNEEQSAALATLRLPAIGIDAGRVAAIADLVRMTKTHVATTAEGRVLVDTDLAVLARPAAGYDAYVAAVREEYAFVPEERWRQGRAAVLEGLLARRPLYCTPPMQAYEATARANLTRELTNLRQ